MIREVLARARAIVVRPSPMRVFAAAIGLLVLLIPALAPLGNVRMLESAGALVVVATIVLPFAGLPTTACVLGILGTTIVAVRDGRLAYPVAESVALLAYLLAVELAATGRDDVRANIARLVGDEAAAFSGGLALIALLAACGVARVDGSYWLAIVGVVAAAAVVVALRWMVPPGSR